MFWKVPGKFLGGACLSRYPGRRPIGERACAERGSVCSVLQDSSSPVLQDPNTQQRTDAQRRGPAHTRRGLGCRPPPTPQRAPGSYTFCWGDEPPRPLSNHANQYSSTPVLQYSSTPAPQYSSTPALQYSSTPVLQYSSTPVLQYSSTPALQYSRTIM